MKRAPPRTVGGRPLVVSICAHLPQRSADALHRTPHQGFIAYQPAVEPLPDSRPMNSRMAVPALPMSSGAALAQPAGHCR
jgi:hypothetical protein